MTAVILTVLDRPELAAGTLGAAQCFASLLGGARINVLAIRLPPEATIMPSEEVLTKRRALDIRAREQQRAQALRTAFDRWAGKAEDRGVSAEWFDLEGLADRLVAEWGRRSDYLVLKRPREDDHVTDRQALHAALFDTSRPVLMTPPVPTTQFGRHVAIAWRDDERTITAVLAGLRCLSRAGRVSVLAGMRPGDARPRMPAILVEHGIEAELHVLPIGRQVFGEALLAKAHELGADMLVAGAFVHSPVRTLVFGGVTRYLLAHADLPVLMRH